MKKADLILCGDIHLMDKIPVCRKDRDTFFDEMWGKFAQILALANEHNCPILCSGDLFDRPRMEMSILTRFLEMVDSAGLAKPIFVIPGQHDVPNHQVEKIANSFMGSAGASRAVEVVPSSPYGTSFSSKGFGIRIFGAGWKKDLAPVIQKMEGFAYVGVIHKHIINTRRPPWPGCTSPAGRVFLRNNPEYDLILSGDNHIPFVEEINGRFLVNPGSMMRTTAAQWDHTPRVYLWYRDPADIQPHYLDIQKDVVSREHIDKEKEMEDRTNAFSEAMATMNFEADLSFKKTLEIIIDTLNPSDLVVDEIWRAYHGQ